MASITAYSYIRFSSPAQMRGDSLRRQTTRSERYAAEHGLTLDTSNRLTDKGLSAFKGTHRKRGALAAFLARVEAKEVERGSYLLVENVDRLSRENPYDAMGLIRRLIDAGITIVTLMDDIVYSYERIRANPHLLDTLQSALTKGFRESKDKADRLQEVWDFKRADLTDNPEKKLTRQGPSWCDFVEKYPGDADRRLYGDWVLNDRVADLTRVFELCAYGGQGKGAISSAMADAGVAPFKHGDGWQQSTVLTLLRDRRVLGELQLYTRTRDEEGNDKRVPSGAPIPNYFPQAISDELFYAAQRELPSGGLERRQVEA